MMDDTFDPRPAVAVSGSLAGWTTEVARLAQGNPVLITAISMAFAGPMLRLAATGPVGLHLHGNAAPLRRAAVLAAASVWGGAEYARTPAQLAHLQALVPAHGGTVLALLGFDASDRDGHVAVRQALRVQGAGGVTEEWFGLADTALLSEGERPLYGHPVDDGLPAGGPPWFNLPVAADDTVELHGYPDADALSDAVQAGVDAHHGAVGEAWQAWVDAHSATITTELAARLVQIRGAGRDSIMRDAVWFDVIALAGFLASHAGLTGWVPGDVVSAVGRCRLTYTGEAWRLMEERMRVVSRLAGRAPEAPEAA